MPHGHDWSPASDADNIPRLPNSRESALYTYDMLISLKRMAETQKQARLASLIEAAAVEAKALSSRE